MVPPVGRGPAPGVSVVSVSVVVVAFLTTKNTTPARISKRTPKPPRRTLARRRRRRTWSQRYLSLRSIDRVVSTGGSDAPVSVSTTCPPRMTLGMGWRGKEGECRSFPSPVLVGPCGSLWMLMGDPLAGYVITVDPGASPQEKTASETLCKYLAKITATPLPVVDPAAAGGRPVLAVGYLAALAAGLPSSQLDGLGTEGYVVKGGLPTRANTPTSFALSGGSGAMRGTIYAVNHLLRLLGFRFYTSTVSKTPGRPSALPCPSVRYIPALEYREPWEIDCWNANWAMMNANNGKASQATDAQGGHITYKGFVHTSYELVPPDPYFKQHPEWFAEINGKRVGENAQLCLSNPDLLVFVIERARQWMAESPTADIISVSQNDNKNYCTCSTCATMDEKEESHQGTLLPFVNAVAEALEKDYPNLKIDTLAYQYTRAPPKTIKPRANVIIRLCSIECDFGRPLTDPNNKKFAEDITGWSAIAPCLYIWDYVTNFANYIIPFPNWFVLGPNIRFFVEHSVKGIFEEGNYQGTGGEMAYLKGWVLAQLLLNPDQDDVKLIEAFLADMYGDAASTMLVYMRLMQESVMKTEFYLYIYYDWNASFLSPDVVLQAAQLMVDAAGKVSDPNILARIDLAKLPVWYVTLLRWDEMRKYAEDHKIPWPIVANKKEAFDEFSTIFHDNNMTVLSEGGHDLNWFRSMVFPSVPSLVLSMERKEQKKVVPIYEDSLKTYVLFRGAVSASMGGLSSRAQIKYLDDEGDYITIASNADVREAVRFARERGGGVLTVFVLC